MTEKINCKKCHMLLYFGEEINRRLYMRAIPSEETVLGLLQEHLPQVRRQAQPDHGRYPDRRTEKIWRMMKN